MAVPLDRSLSRLRLRLGALWGGLMARRRSIRQKMAVLSATLFAAVVVLAVVGGVKIGRHEVHAGIQLVGWSVFLLALFLGLCCPTTCKVRTARGTPCRNEAYGFLFGCNRGVGHWLEKFLVRFGLKHEIGNKSEHRSRSARSGTAIRNAVSETQSVSVSVEDSFLGICGFWVGVVSAVAGVVQVIAIFVH